MGYGFQVWAVNTDRLRQVMGSKDEELFERLGGHLRQELPIEDAIRNLVGHRPGIRGALHEIIHGTIPEDARGSDYRYAFELVVEHWGTFLDNGAVYPWSSPDFTAVNGALAALGIPFDMDTLYGLDLPVSLPDPDDFPSTGWVDAARVQVINDAFVRAPDVEIQMEAADVLECVRAWFRDAATQGLGLVSYYH